MVQVTDNATKSDELGCVDRCSCGKSSTRGYIAKSRRGDEATGALWRSQKEGKAAAKRATVVNDRKSVR